MLFHEPFSEPSLTSFGELNAKLQSVRHVAIFLGDWID